MKYLCLKHTNYRDDPRGPSEQGSTSNHNNDESENEVNEVH